mgnify:CR=1 FL=1
MKRTTETWYTIKYVSAAVIVAVSPFAVVADSAVGDFNVEASVPAVCEIANVEELVIDVDEQADTFVVDTTDALDTATFDVSCKGSPTVSTITFDGGQSELGGQRQMTEIDDPTQKIGYNFYVVGPGKSKADVVLSEFIRTNEGIDFNATVPGTATFTVAAADNAYNGGDKPSDIPFGVYTDTVTITVNYQ